MPGGACSAEAAAPARGLAYDRVFPGESIEMETTVDYARVRHELVTFRRPAKLAVSEVPQVGDRARSLPVTVGDGRPVVVLFLRHTGCPFAEATVIAAREAAAQQPDVDFVAVSHASEDSTDTWCGEIGGADRVRVVSDPSRVCYAAWGLDSPFGLTKDDLAYLFSADVRAAVKGLRSRGIVNRDPTGSRWQRSGSFAVDGTGIIRWRHLPAHAGELPDIDAAVRVVTGRPAIVG
jgi:hypothetical protein